MKIDINAALTIVLGLVALIGSIYRLAKVEADIHRRISHVEASTLVIVDVMKDILMEKINITNTELKIHVTKYEADKEYVYLYRLNNNEKTIEHKFNRLANWITQIAGFLHRKEGFQIRDDKF
ncbi:MAG: hypothetical protein V7K26_00100 [Nostoc sp.]|uniref:hypothetical protein n=1 Tax=Nostoc sp. TaxID=1180 RepID=UPI002FF14227